MIADLHEALEELHELKPLYLAVLRQTGDKDQARKAVVYVRRISREMAAEKKAG